MVQRVPAARVRKVVFRAVVLQAFEGVNAGLPMMHLHFSARGPALAHCLSLWLTHSRAMATRNAANALFPLVCVVLAASHSEMNATGSAASAVCVVCRAASPIIDHASPCCCNSQAQPKNTQKQHMRFDVKKNLWALRAQEPHSLEIVFVLQVVRLERAPPQYLLVLQPETAP